MFLPNREVTRSLPCPLRTMVLTGPLFSFPPPSLTWTRPQAQLSIPHFGDEKTRPWARRDWPESSGARILAGLPTPAGILSSPRRALCTLGLGWGQVSGLGRVGSRAQKAQCLPLPPPPGPALLREPGGCPAPDWAKRATCDICAHLRAQPHCWTHLPCYLTS